MQVQENYSLQSLNTFGLPATARYFASFSSVSQLNEILTEYSTTPRMILGGGSNILFTRNVDRLVLRNEIRGISKTEETDEYVHLQVGAGENWHQFVMYCIDNGFAGAENLSLIPGLVGASPMQNIGAYGVEIRDIFHQLKAFHLEERANYTFGLKDCAFGYRESVFKRKYKEQFAITHVTFRLSKKPEFRIGYGAIREELDRMRVTELSIRAVSDAVIRIRQSKLPDPAKVGNAGSFFKNPSVAADRYQQLKKSNPGVVGYENADGTIKLAAGWLIEQAGWKGYRRGDAGVHDRQALVLVNHGQATGEEIVQLSEDIMASVREKFGVELEREVNLV